MREHCAIRKALRRFEFICAIRRSQRVACGIAGNERRIIARLLPGKTSSALLENRIAHLVGGRTVYAIRYIEPGEVRIARCKHVAGALSITAAASPTTAFSPSTQELIAAGRLLAGTAFDKHIELAGELDPGRTTCGSSPARTGSTSRSTPATSARINDVEITKHQLTATQESNRGTP